MNITQFIPINTGEKFTDNTITITKNKNPSTFIASSSSFFSDSYKPFQAFNGTTDNSIFWQSNTSPNPNNPNPIITKPKLPNPYTQPPYVKNDGSYQGGGRNNGYYFSTNINNANGNNSISNGEWIQMQLSTPILLSLYSILTPSQSSKIANLSDQQDNINYFPQKFTLAGSNDGITWNFIDYQNINNNDYNCQDRKPISFTVSSTTPYSYFRLIISKLPNNNTVVKINQFNLSGIYSSSSSVDFTDRRSVTSMDDLGFSMPLRGSEKPSKESFTGNRIQENLGSIYLTDTAPINPQFSGSYPSLNTFSSNFSNFFISEPMTSCRGVSNHISSQSSHRFAEANLSYPLLITDDAILETIVYEPSYDNSYEDDKIFVATIILILTGTFLYTLFTNKR